MTRAIGRALLALAPAVFAGAGSAGAATADAVAASVGDRAITLADVQAALAALPDGGASRVRDAKARAAFLNELVEEELLAQEAERRGLSAAPAVDVERKLAAISWMLAKATPGEAEKVRAAARARARAAVAAGKMFRERLAKLVVDPATAPHDLGAAAADVVLEAEGGKLVVRLGTLQASIDREHPERALLYKDAAMAAKLVGETTEIEALAAAAFDRGGALAPEVMRKVRRALADELLRREARPALPSEIAEPAARAWYDAHRDEFRVPAARRAGHVLLATEAHARAVAKEVPPGFAGAGRFAELARLHSKDPATRVLGGDLGFMLADGRPAHEPKAAPAAPPEVVAAVWKLVAGGDVAVVKTARGWHVVRLSAVRKPLDRKFEEVAERCRKGAAEEAAAARTATLLVAARAASKVKTHPEVLDGLAAPAGLGTPAVTP